MLLCLLVLGFRAALLAAAGAGAPATLPASTQPAADGASSGTLGQGAIHHVLVLSSYSPGYLWSDEEMRGLFHVFRDRDMGVDLRVEYMDWNRYPTRANINELRQLYMHKYAGVPIDTIVTLDNQAMNFALRYRGELFGKPPIVFCGVNGVNQIAPALPKDVTGVAEHFMIPETLELMLRLQPRLRTILVIMDETETGLAIRQEIDAASRPYRSRVRIRYSPGLGGVEQLVQDVEALGPDSAILLGSYHRDPSGRFMDSPELIRLVTSHATVPVYHLWDYGMGMGVIGGYLANGEYQGRRAAEMTMQILHGTPVSAMPIEAAPPAAPVFDYRELQRYGMDTAALPPGSQVLFRPISYYATHRTFVWSVAAVITALALAVALLVVNTIQRRRAEAALRFKNEAMEHSLNGFHVLGEDGRFVYANRSYLRMWGYDRLEEILGSSPARHYQDPDTPQRIIAALQEHGRTTQECVARRKDGSTFEVLMAAQLLHDNRRAFYIGSSIDITAQHQAERERATLLESERTARLQAETATHAKDQFLAIVSHELRTPLTPVVPAVDLLLSQAPPEDQRELLETIRQSILAESRLIGDLLDMTRLGTGGLQLHRKRFDLHPIIDQCLPTAYAVMGSRRVEVERHYDAQQAVVDGDEVRMAQVICNLVGNAAKFTPEGGRVTLRTSNPRPGWVQVDVEDTGVGMEPEVLERIFKPFEQADPSITRRFGGMGLGLYVSRTLVDLHGGRLSAHSRGKDQGSVFRLELPLAGALAGAGAGAGAGGAAPSGAGEVPKAPPLRILLVEDNPTTLRLYRQFLQKQGHRVMAAGDAERAREIAGREEVDVLVSDLGLPGVSGWELMRDLHASRGLAGIAVSGFGTASDIERSRSAGFARHLVKPVEMSQLARALQEVAGGPRKAGRAGGAGRADHGRSAQ